MLELFRSKHTSFVWCTEAVLLMAMLFVAADIQLTWESAPRLARFACEAILVAMVAQGSLYYCGLYADELISRPERSLDRFAKGIAASAAIMALIDYAFDLAELRTRVALFGLAISAIALPLWRWAYHSIARSHSFARRVLVLGSSDLAHDITAVLQDRVVGLHLVGRLCRPAESSTQRNGFIGTYDDLLSIVASSKVDMVIVADSDRRGALPVEQLLALKLNGIEVHEGSVVYERLTGKIHVRSIRPSELFFTDGFDHRPFARKVKRVFDVIAAATGLVATAPIMALTALAIRLESPGPVFYKQLRVGEHRREFWMLKFRSMRPDAEKDGARWASAQDDRITRVGRFIRRTRIDELPQLWNVLRGDMSLVGPRPERPVFVDELERTIPYFSQRLYVRPGVTGHAQVRCRYAASVEDSIEKLQYDLYYIKRFSLMFDISILLDTVKVVLLRIGSR